MPSPFSNSTLDVRFFDDLIRARGEWVKLYAGMRCPCGVDPSQADFTCPNCRGLGHFYPSAPSDLCVLITDVKMNRDLMSIPGFALPGDLSCTMRPLRGPLSPLYDFDKIVLTFQEGIPFDGETIIADPSGVDHTLNQIVQVQTVCWINPDSAVYNELVYATEGADFTISAPNVLRWVSPTHPTPGQPFTIRYTGQPEWLVLNPPNIHYERGTSLGQTALLRKRTVVLGR